MDSNLEPTDSNLTFLPNLSLIFYVEEVLALIFDKKDFIEPFLVH